MPTVLITGANRGLGLEFARQYAADGWSVIACCRDPAKADALKNLAGSNESLCVETLDVGDANTLRLLAERLKDTAIDLLINNAGIYSGADGSLGNDASQSFGTIDAKAWAKVLYTNTIAPMLVTQAFAPHLQKGKDKKIVNITSRMGSLTEMGAGSLAYRSSKTALNGAMRVVKHDLDKIGLAIFNFHPGWVQTDMGGKSAHLTPAQSITAMRASIAKLALEDSGQFFNYDGQIIPW